MSTPASQQKNLGSISGKYLLLRLGAEGYAISVDNVLEIVRNTKITRVPNMPSYIKGVVNLRGKVVPVYDLRDKLHIQKTEDQKILCMVVAQVVLNERGLTSVAIVVDAVDSVVELSNCPYEEMPELGTAVHREWTNGIVDVSGNSFTLLNIKQLLEDEQIEH